MASTRIIIKPVVRGEGTGALPLQDREGTVTDQRFWTLAIQRRFRYYTYEHIGMSISARSSFQEKFFWKVSAERTGMSFQFGQVEEMSVTGDDCVCSGYQGGFEDPVVARVGGDYRQALVGGYERERISEQSDDFVE